MRPQTDLLVAQSTACSFPHDTGSVTDQQPTHLGSFVKHVIPDFMCNRKGIPTLVIFDRGIHENCIRLQMKFRQECWIRKQSLINQFLNRI